MFVTTRSGKREPVQFDKITHRISQLVYGLDFDHVDATQIAKRTIQGLFDGITTEELDNLSAEVSAYMTSAHPDYARLAGRIAVANLHRSTRDSFTETLGVLYNFENAFTKEKSPLISEEIYAFAIENKNRIEAEIAYSRDYEFDYFDEQGWPHFKVLDELPYLKPGEQTILMKEAIVMYFEKKY
jgi:hypothetical protein